MKVDKYTGIRGFNALLFSVNAHQAARQHHLPDCSSPSLPRATESEMGLLQDQAGKNLY
jgi:hypothetical protein